MFRGVGIIDSNSIITIVITPYMQYRRLKSGWTRCGAGTGRMDWGVPLFFWLSFSSLIVPLGGGNPSTLGEFLP